MKYTWQNLPDRKNCFTTRRAVMKDLDTGKTIQVYSANTKIAVTQKCVTTSGTFYRTDSACQNGLNWAFEASALGLPNEKAPLAQPKKLSTSGNSRKSTSKKTNISSKKSETSRAEGASPRKSFFARLFHRK